MKRPYLFHRAAPIAAAAMLATTALAAAPRVVTHISVDKTSHAIPGDVLTYTVSLTNVGDAAARRVIAVDPIPHGTAFVPGSATPTDAHVEFSIDGGRTWSAAPLQVSSDHGARWTPATPADLELFSGARAAELPSGTETVSAGGRSFRRVPSARYTHVRWIFNKPLLPHQRDLVSLQVKVK